MTTQSSIENVNFKPEWWQVTLLAALIAVTCGPALIEKLRAESNTAQSYAAAMEVDQAAIIDFASVECGLDVPKILIRAAAIHKAKKPEQFRAELEFIRVGNTLERNAFCMTVQPYINRWKTIAQKSK
jgi:hypothetical protein